MGNDAEKGEKFWEYEGAKVELSKIDDHEYVVTYRHYNGYIRHYSFNTYVPAQDKFYALTAWLKQKKI